MRLAKEPKKGTLGGQKNIPAFYCFKGNIFQTKISTISSAMGSLRGGRGGSPPRVSPFWGDII